MIGKFYKSFRPAILAFLVVTFLMNYVFINALIPSGSMEPTIMTGDRVIGFRFLRHFKRGDIVIFKDPDQGGYYLIKRIIGTPGDTVTIRDGIVSVNGTVLDEPYIKELMFAEAPFSITLPEDGYFVMGDNRNDSYDARFWENKVLYGKKIAGIAKFRYWPLKSAGTI